jgi:hypothetical protein
MTAELQSGDLAMRPFAVAVTLALAASTTFAEPPKKGAAKLPPGYAWETNFEQAKLKAAEAGKLLYIDFYTDW